MTIKKLLIAAAALLLVTACGHKSTGRGTSTSLGGVSNTATSHSSTASLTACDELQSERVGDTVHFAYDSSMLSEHAKAVLKRQAEFMKVHSDSKFTISGHADERGTREYNLGLGERRASAVEHYLNSLGIHSNKITTVSYGKERPLALGHDESAWSQNRRATTSIN